ncbi:hypothetical protein HY2_14785 [Hyphomonas pacifica]|nr:hypothetical protein HY2_14785 [Hyphomonas pacifica]
MSLPFYIEAVNKMCQYLNRHVIFVSFPGETCFQARALRLGFVWVGDLEGWYHDSGFHTG